MISDTHRCIFVHIPKCGGSSIEALLWPGKRTESELWMGFVDDFHNKYQTGGLQHLHADQIRTEVGEERFGSYFKFGFVRNPFDRAVSQFAYMRNRADLRSFIGMGEGDSFSRYLRLIERRLHVQWEPQYRFVCGHDDTLVVDFVGRFEELDAGMARVLAVLGVELKALPHENRGTRGPYRDYYRRADRRAVERLYAKDLELFGYDY